MKVRNIECIPRKDHETQEIILFFPKQKTDKYSIEYYALSGEHGTASFDYYQKTKFIPKKEEIPLLKWYEKKYECKIIRRYKITRKEKNFMWK